MRNTECIQIDRTKPNQNVLHEPTLIHYNLSDRAYLIVILLAYFSNRQRWAVEEHQKRSFNRHPNGVDIKTACGLLRVGKPSVNVSVL